MARGLGKNRRGFANSAVTKSVTTPIAGTELSDPVSLYLPFDSDVNDDSTNAHSGTASGSAAITTSVKKYGAGSLSLNGTSQYVTYANDVDFQFGSGDFTIEAWIYQTADAGSSGSSLHPIVARYDSSSNRSFRVYIEEESGNQVLAWGYSTDGSTAINAQFNTNVTNNTWHHIAIVRSGTTITGYLDGVAHGTTQNAGSDSFFVGTSDLTVGFNGKDSAYFQGYIDDLRISKGVARYTKSFIPPSQAVGAKLSGSNETNTTTDLTSLYLPFDSDVNDDSDNNHTVTAQNSAAISSTQSKFGGNSLSLNGTDQYLSVAGSTDFDFGTGDFTIEAWIYPSAATGSHIISSGGAGYWSISWNKTSRYFQFYRSGGTESVGLQTPNYSLSLNQWQHVAACRMGTQMKLFINGSEQALIGNPSDGGVINASNSFDSDSSGIEIGRNYGSSNSDQHFQGYLDDIRIIKGYAKYTADFAPPTSAVGTSVSETVNDLTVLYMPFDDDSFEDQARNHGVIKEGTVAISTSVKKLGTSSAYFAAADDELHIPGGKFNLGSSFTIEGWYYLTEYTEHSVGFLYDEIGGSSSKDTLVLGLATSDNKVRFQIGLNGGSEYIMVGHDATNTKLSLNTWTHVACVRDGTNLYLFKDGVQQGATMTVSSSSLVTSQTSADHVLVVGGSAVSPSPYSNHGMKGYIDDFRIIDGVALYTSNFTPPTSAVGSAVESGGVTSNVVDNKFLSSVWSLKDQNKKISKGEWIRNDATDTGVNAKGRSIKGAGLQDENHRWYEAPVAPSSTVTIKVYGAGGGGGKHNGSKPSPLVGGDGGVNQATFTIPAGTELNVVVGQGGRGYQPGAGGTFGGGSGQGTTGPGQGGGGGGGYSGVFEGPATQGNALIIAGGGGGSSGNSPGQQGGDGGMNPFTAGTLPGAYSGNSGDQGSSNPGKSGGGGTVSAGGSSGSGTGSALQGGNSAPGGGYNSSGGGGGGYYGGGAGTGYGAGPQQGSGGGGSAYTNTSAYSAVQEPNSNILSSLTQKSGGAGSFNSSDANNGQDGSVEIIDGSGPTVYTYTGSTQTHTVT